MNRAANQFTNLRWLYGADSLVHPLACSFPHLEDHRADQGHVDETLLSTMQPFSDGSSSASSLDSDEGDQNPTAAFLAIAAVDCRDACLFDARLTNTRVDRLDDEPAIGDESPSQLTLSRLLLLTELQINLRICAGLPVN